MTAVGTDVLEWRLNFTAWTDYSAIGPQSLGNLWNGPRLSDLGHEVFCYRLQSLDLVLQATHEVFHAFTSDARFRSGLRLLHSLIRVSSGLKGLGLG